MFCIVHGSSITARRATDERTICRDISHFKLVNTVVNSADDRAITEAGESSTTADPSPEKFISFPRYVEEPSISEMGEENKRKKQSEEQNQEQTGSDQIQSSERQTEADPESCRPQRTRRKPSYSKDYVLT